MRAGVRLPKGRIEQNPIYAYFQQQQQEEREGRYVASWEKRIQELIDTNMFINDEAEQRQGFFKCRGKYGRQCILDENGVLYDQNTGETFDRNHTCCDDKYKDLMMNNEGRGVGKRRRTRKARKGKKSRRKARKGKQSRRKGRKRRRRRTKKH